MSEPPVGLPRVSEAAWASHACVGYLVHNTLHPQLSKVLPARYAAQARESGDVLDTACVPACRATSQRPR